MFCDTFREPSALQDFILPPSFRGQPFQYFVTSLTADVSFRVVALLLLVPNPSADIPQAFRGIGIILWEIHFVTIVIGSQISERSETCCKN